MYNSFLGHIVHEYIVYHFEKGFQKKHRSAHDKSKRWCGYSLVFAYWPGGNVQVCIFARGEFVLPLRRTIA